MNRRHSVEVLIWLATFLVVPLSSLPSSLRAADAAPDEKSVSKFVRKAYIHGIPIREARELGPEDIGSLKRLLRDPGEVRHWANIVDTINYIGSPEGYAIIEDFLWNRFKGEVGLSTFQALISSQMTRGYLVARNLQFYEELSKGLDPQHWMKLEWGFEGQEGRKLAVIMSMATITAIATTGTDEALVTLRALKEKPYAPRQIGSIEDGLVRVEEIRAAGGFDKWLGVD